MKLATALRGFEMISSILAPHCTKIELFGSCAAGCEAPGDLDMAICPWDEALLRRVVLAHAALNHEVRFAHRSGHGHLVMWRCTWPGVGKVDLRILPQN